MTNGIPAKTQTGFTLTELMVVVVIVAIISMIAYPQYVDYVRKTERKTAIGKSLEIASRVEQFRTQRLAYPSAQGDLDGFALEETKYEYAVDSVVSNGEVSGYSITVTPQGDQANDECGTLVFDSAGGWSFDNSLTEAECL